MPLFATSCHLRQHPNRNKDSSAIQNMPRIVGLISALSRSIASKQSNPKNKPPFPLFFHNQTFPFSTPPVPIKFSKPTYRQIISFPQKLLFPYASLLPQVALSSSPPLPSSPFWLSLKPPPPFQLKPGRSSLPPFPLSTCFRHPPLFFP